MLKSEAKHWMDRMRVAVENGKREGNKHANRAGHTFCRNSICGHNFCSHAFDNNPFDCRTGKRTAHRMMRKVTRMQHCNWESGKFRTKR